MDLKKVVKAILLFMTILTVIYVSAVVYANSNYDSSDDFYDYDHLYAAFEYESDTPPTEWYTPEELGIYDVIERGENDSSWLNIAVDLAKEPFPLQSVIFLYKDKFYQVSAHPWLSRYVGYAAFRYKADTPPSDWYTPEQLGIYYVIEYGENASGLHIAVDLAKEPFPLQNENPIFLYKDKFYRVSSLWVTFSSRRTVRWPILIVGGALGAGWIIIGVLFLKWRKNE